MQMKAVVQTEGLPPGQQLYRFYYPFNPLVLIPSTIYFWKQKNKITGGSSDRIPIANMAPQSVMEVGSENSRSATDTVYFFGEVK